MSDIKTLAEAVAGWGNCTEAWLDTSEDDASAVVGHIDEDGNTYPVAVIDCEQYYADHDSLKLARFYAAANPAAVLGLVAEVDSLRQQLAAVERQRDDLKAEAHRYQWLRIHGLQRAWVSLGTDCDGQNFADFKCEFKVPEPPNA